MKIRNAKRILAKFPVIWQQRLKRVHYWIQIRSDRFISEEPEYRILNELVSGGDWVIDVGANIGQYTLRFSKLVGKKGRVIAIEPVLETFVILTENLRQIRGSNVTLLNVAASDNTNIGGMRIPLFETGLKNYYQAQLTLDHSDVNVMTISIDCLDLNNCISLVKIDAEGQELKVLNGMRKLIERDHPTFIIEVGDKETIKLLKEIGYQVSQLPTSPNMIFKYKKNYG